MEDDNDKKENPPKGDLAKLKEQVAELNRQKEDLFSKRSTVSAKIKSLIDGIKGTKTERNTLTDSVKGIKEERDRLNSQIKEKISLLKKLRENLPKLEGRDRRMQSPGFLKKQIDDLEQSIEHEVMSFEKETKIMKQIKDLKRKYGELKSSNDGWDQIRSLSKEVTILKKQADEKHRIIQESARSSQEKHKGILDVSKEIESLKTEEKSLHDQFLAKKAEYTALNEQLKPMLMEAGFAQTEVREKKKKKREEQDTQDKERTKKKLSELRQEVEEKLKRGDKLTTDDIRILQSGDME